MMCMAAPMILCVVPLCNSQFRTNRPRHPITVHACRSSLETILQHRMITCSCGKQPGEMCDAASQITSGTNTLQYSSDPASLYPNAPILCPGFVFFFLLLYPTIPHTPARDTFYVGSLTILSNRTAFIVS
ncbi:hypothetical protein EDC01DRAFT_194562 [Geopyxis carbonaria]|nr:hypothetical protein EDC01DRAFT_194562 [Geopyxis carbonaria]